MTSAMTMLGWGVVQYRSAYANSGLLPQMLDALKWGTGWIIKAHPSANVFYAQVGNGGTDHAFWDAPEVMGMARPSYRIDPQHPGSDVAAEATASLAAASIVFRPTDSELRPSSMQCFNRQFFQRHGRGERPFMANMR